MLARRRRSVTTRWFPTAAHTMVHDDVMSRVTIEIDDERVTAAQRMHRPDWKRIMAPVGRMRRSRAPGDPHALPTTPRALVVTANSFDAVSHSCPMTVPGLVDMQELVAIIRTEPTNPCCVRPIVSLIPA